MGYIGRKAATTILHSARTARSLDRPFTCYLTLRLWELGSDPDSIAKDFASIRDWFRRWSERSSTRKGTVVQAKNGPPTHIYAIETSGSITVGEYVHVHWAIHLQDGNEDRFLKALKNRIKRQFNVDEVPEEVIHVRPVYNDEGLKLYLVKAIDPRYADLWGIEHQDGGRVKGRRADASRNLGPRVWKVNKAAYKAEKRAIFQAAAKPAPAQQGAALGA